MRLIKMFSAIFIMSIISLACEPEALPEEQPKMDDQIIKLEKAASGDEDNPIIDDRNGD
ncbi:hypothetical protein [Salegentibacter sp. UBA1130]|uniref:hypothetical protein n=1 Tax=Salegentibacter sp. UBA1130 TaxID=1947451 RepID=UPI00257E1B2C|nr:hypothetical protein [Salegentibacter sp. UBA1130]